MSVIDVSNVITDDVIDFVVGDKYTLSIPVTDENGASADLSGYTPAATILRDAGTTLTLSPTISGSSVEVSISKTDAQTVDANSLLTVLIESASDRKTLLMSRIRVLG